MFGNPHFDRLRLLFAQQFEGEAPDITYRRNSKSAPVRVSAEERAAFIAAFARTIRYSSWGLMTGMIVLTIVLVTVAVSSNSDVSNLSIYGGIGVLLALFFGLIFRAWYAPARALQDRLTTGAARSSDETRRIHFASISYGRLAVLAVFGALLIIANRRDVYLGWEWIWVVFGAVMLTVAAVQAFRKWRFETTSKHP